jgi:hypothetical protein
MGALVALLPVLLTAPAARAEGTGRVEGVVVSHATRAPVAGAVVTLPALGATAVSHRDGSFAFAQPFGVEGPYRRVRAVVTAEGFGTWTIRGVPIWGGDTLRLNVELRRTAFDHRVQTPAERDRADRRTAASAPTGNTCTGWDYTLVPPETIWVWRTATDVAEQYDFLFYTQHVLPNEWINTWDADALGAGAIAVKTYAWYMEGTGHARFGGADCADVYDDWHDQFFDPTWSAASTDLALDATFGSILQKKQNTFPTQYWAGTKGDPCAPVTQGEFAGRMSQWGSQTCATEGEVWPDIDTTFYQGTKFSYLSNLLLNANLQSDPLYPWEPRDDTTITRIKDDGQAYNGNAYLKVKPPAGANGAVTQIRRYVGKTSTVYTGQVALRCDPTNTKACTITIRLIARPDTGNRWVNRWDVTVPNDGSWTLFDYDPPKPGIQHDQAEYSFISAQTFGVDAAVLLSPYGGP